MMNIKCMSGGKMVYISRKNMAFITAEIDFDLWLMEEFKNSLFPANNQKQC